MGFFGGFSRKNEIELVFQDQLFEYFSEIIYLVLSSFILCLVHKCRSKAIKLYSFRMVRTAFLDKMMLSTSLSIGSD